MINLFAFSFCLFLAGVSAGQALGTRYTDGVLAVLFLVQLAMAGINVPFILERMQ